MTDEEKKAAEEKAAAEADAALNARINAAISTHMKRATATFEKTLSEQIAKLAPTKADEKPVDEKPAGGKVDPELVKLRETVDKLTRSQAEADARAKAAETKAARDSTHAALKEQLDALGIKGVRARAVIHDLEASGQLKLNEESGSYELAVKRSRSKGARPEEVTYDDLGAGLKDWSQTDDAREFLPAAQATQGAAQGAARRATTALPRTQTDLAAPRRATTADADRALANLNIPESAVFGDD